MPLYVNDGSTWRQIIGVYVNDGGTWRRIHTIHVRDGGSWRAIGIGTVTVSGASINGFATATLRFNSDGTVDQNEDGSIQQISASTDWIIPNASASGIYSIRATLQSGTTPTTNAGLGTWLPLSSTREWGFISQPAGNSCSLLIEISADGGSSVLASNTYSLAIVDI